MSLTDFDTRLTTKFPARLRMGMLNMAAPILALMFVFFLPDTAWAAITCDVDAPKFARADFNILDGTSNHKLASNIRINCSNTDSTYDMFVHVCFYIYPTNNGFSGSGGFHGLPVYGEAERFLKFKFTIDGPIVQNKGTRGNTGRRALTVPAGRSNTASVPAVLTFDLSDQTAVKSDFYKATYVLTAVYNKEYIYGYCHDRPNDDSFNTITMVMDINVTVAKACIFQNVSNIDFGRIGGIEAMRSPKTARGEIGVRCTVDLPYRVTMDSGLNADGSIRRMKLSKPAATNPNGSDQYLAYSLANCNPSSVQDGSLGSGLGGAIAGKSSVVASGKTASVQQIDKHQVCATLAPITTSPAAGTYSDRVVLNLEF